MQRDEDEDAVWRSIVDNYGERPELDPATPEAAASTAPEADPSAEPVERPEPPEPVAPAFEPIGQVEDPEWLTEPSLDPADRFVPPDPPPVPRPTLDRRIAWLGVFGSPAILLICLIARIGLPPLLAYALVAGFVGGFVYLVWQMPRGPRDPWDDGAQI